MLISVIVPVYKVEKYLPACVESILAQTHKDLEIILVDDGSPDGCLDICMEFAEMDPRVQVVSQENAGVTAARMNGFLHSHGEFIMFVDGDDYIAPDMVELMVKAQQEYQVDIVSCQYYDVEYGQAVPAVVRPKPGYYDRDRLVELLKKNFLYDKCTEIAGMSGYLWTRLFKKTLVQLSLEAGQGLVHSEDQIGLFQALYNADSMYVMEEPLYYYVVRQGQATRSYNAAYWKNFKLFFARMQEIDRENYLKDQLPDRVAMILRSLIKMEFDNDKLSIFQRYRSLKKNFSNELWVLCKDADTSAMGKKMKLQYYLSTHKAFMLYGAFIYLNNIRRAGMEVRDKLIDIIKNRCFDGGGKAEP